MNTTSMTVETVPKVIAQFNCVKAKDKDDTYDAQSDFGALVYIVVVLVFYSAGQFTHS